MSSLRELQSQIDKLQQKVTEVKRRDFEKVVFEIIGNMQSYGVSMADIVEAKKKSAKNVSTQDQVNRSAKPIKAYSKSTNALIAKFSGPKGETWTGRGLTPRWLAALITQGHKREDFAVRVDKKPQ